MFARPRPLAQPRLPLALALFGAVAAMNPAFADPVPFPYFSSFEESEGFDLGPFTSDPVWTSAPGLDLSITDIAYDGDHSLSLLGSGWLGYVPTATGATFGYPVTWVDLFSRPVFAPQADLPASIAAASATATGFVKLGAEGEVFAVDGSGQGGGDWVASGHRTVLEGDRSAAWLRLTYRIDYAHKTWDLYLNGTLALADLGFIDGDLGGFTRFSLRGDASTAALLDSFYAGELNPLFADANNQGIPDAWFLAHGLTGSGATRYADSDRDGLTNLQEYVLGLSPVVPDTDGDGIHDGREMLRGTNPLVADTWAPSAFPFADGFELDAPGALPGGTRQWAVTLGSGSSAEIVTGAAAEGARSLRLSGTDAILARDFAQVSGVTAVWIDFQAQLAPRAVSAPEIAPDSAAAFYFSSSGDVMAFDGNGNGSGGGTWHGVAQLPAPGASLPAPAWHRYTLHLNYAAQTWSLWFDGVRVARDFGFAHPVPFFSGLSIAHDQAQQATGLDGFSFAAVEPIALDNDGDGMPNSWEVSYGLNPDDQADATTSLSGDGWANIEKFQFGVSPTVSHLSALPLFEPFEQLTAGSLLQGANSWFYLGGTAPQIQSADVHEGAQALLIPASEDGVRVVTRIDGSGHSIIWTEFALKAVPFPADATPALSPESTAGLFFIQTGHLRVYDGHVAGWRTLASAAVDLAEWHTVTLRHDYATQRWSVWIDGAPMAENLGFAHPVAAYKKFEVTGGADAPTLIDSIRVQAIPPLILDPTALPEWWRLQHFGTLAVDPAADPDGDGLSNLDEYLQGRLPLIADTPAPGSPASAVLYVNSIVGSDTLYNGLSAAANQPATGYGPKASLSAALSATGNEGRIIISASEAAYTENTIPLIGKNLVLRPHGDARITRP
jgi:hypothetical protein